MASFSSGAGVNRGTSAQEPASARVEGAGADGDAVVAAGDGGVGDEDARGVLDADAIGVGALRRGAAGQPADEHAAAAVEPDVELRACAITLLLMKNLTAWPKTRISKNNAVLQTRSVLRSGG